MEVYIQLQRCKEDFAINVSNFRLSTGSDFIIHALLGKCLVSDQFYGFCRGYLPDDGLRYNTLRAMEATGEGDTL